MLSGGLGMLQTGSIVAAFPFAIIMLFAMVAMIKSVKAEHKVDGVADLNKVADASMEDLSEAEELEEAVE